MGLEDYISLNLLCAETLQSYLYISYEENKIYDTESDNFQ